MRLRRLHLLSALALCQLNLPHLSLVVLACHIVLGVGLRLERESFGEVLLELPEALALLLLVDFDPVKEGVDMSVFVGLGDDFTGVLIYVRLKRACPPLVDDLLLL